MKRFCEEAEAIWMRPVGIRTRSNSLKKLLSKEDVDRLFGLLDEALTKATEAPYRDRVEAMIADCKPLKSLYGAPPKDRPILAVTSIRESKALVVDGKLDEPFWKGL